MSSLLFFKILAIVPGSQQSIRHQFPSKLVDSDDGSIEPAWKFFFDAIN